MGESTEKSFWDGYKEFWGERFSGVENYFRFIKRIKRLPEWSSSDADEFVASDPIHGPTFKTAREARKFAITGAVIGAASTAGIAWKYSRSLHGTGLSLAAGAFFGLTFGEEVANHWFQLYRLDTTAAEVKFVEWWERKTAGRA